MRIAKTILVILIGVSVALLPAGRFAASAPSTTTVASVTIPDCNHHKQAPADRTQKSDSDCISIAACVLHCFSFAGVVASIIAFLPLDGITLQPLRASDRLSPQLGSLPFRPPRA